ncbi:MAG TPA: SRPBCC domain-containing protein [Candidatus Saccharimonadales bacterium]|nr:SRPBCC domain-containing protein [Candidatus Saccharimonadales bacterium]
MAETKVTKDTENKTLIIEREFDAPKEKLWKAYADKDWFEKWWGPEGWQTTTKTFEFKVGGHIHYGMKCVDKNQGEWFGQESWGLMEITKIDQMNSFEALDHFSNPEGTVDQNMPTQKFIVEFVEENGKTKLVSRSVCDTAEQLEQLVKMGMVEGFSSQLNRLEALLAE